VSGEARVLYDIRKEEAPVGGTIAAGVGGVLVGFLLLAIVWKRRERVALLFAVSWIVGWAGLAAWTAHGISSRHDEAREWVETRSVEVVEGPVTHLSPASADRGGIETFRIGERIIRIEDGQRKLPGLNRSSVRGGPIRSGATVRLTLHGESILVVEELAPPPPK
jgi:hypothetical protein